MSADANFDFDRPITFNQAARYLPEGSRPSYVTWWRWWRHGIKGVHLRTLVCGGRRYTTRGALEEFISTLTAAANDEQPPARTPRQRQRDIEAAEREVKLAKMQSGKVSHDSLLQKDQACPP